jgi:N-acetyltransferase
MRPLVVRPVALEGSFVRLEPLSLNHLDGLCRIGLDAELWRWAVQPVRTDVDMYDYVAEALREQADGRALPWATVERATGQVVGCTRYGAIEPAHRRLEIGWTWIGRAWQRTPVNTEAKYLQLRHAFEVLGCLRVEWKTDALNERSRAAILRLGAKEEGTLRSHMIAASGRVRDTVYYSMLASEWPPTKQALLKKLGRSSLADPG